MLTATLFRSKEIVAAGIVFLVALIVSMGIIPPVRADTSPMAAPESAAASFWVVGVIFNLLVGSTLCIALFLTRRGRMVGQVLAGIAGLAAFVVGLLLLMPAGAFAGHGPALLGARVAMAVAAVGDFAASVLALSAAGILGRFGPAMRLLGQNLRTHRRAEAIFLALWLALLGAAGAAWFGLLPGWNQLALLCVLLPVPAGILVGWWRNVPAARQDQGHVTDSLLGGSLVGAIVMVLTQIVLVGFDAVQTLLSGALYPLGWEGVNFVAVFVIIGFVQGAIGGLLGAGLAAIRRGRGGPATPVAAR
jgi:hypothetical protein